MPICLLLRTELVLFGINSGDLSNNSLFLFEKRNDYVSGESDNYHPGRAVRRRRVRFRLLRQLRMPYRRRGVSVLPQRQRAGIRQPVSGRGAAQYDGAAAARFDSAAHRPHGGFQGDILRFFARSFRRGGVPSGPFVLPYPGRAADLLPSGAGRRRGCDLVPDGGLHLP